MWIETLPSGRHRGAFRTPAGRKVTKTFDYAYEAEAWAIDAEKRALAATDDSPAPKAKGPRVSTHGSGWVARRSGGLTTATVSGYKTHLRAIAATDLGRQPLTGPRRSDVEQWVTDQVRAGVGKPTINARLKVLRMIFRDALAEGLCDRDPTEGVKFLTTDIRADRTVTQLEQAQLVAQAGPELTAMLLLALDAGLRWEEAAAVGVDCFLGDYLVVRQVVERDSRLVRAYPKGHRARVVPMTQRLIDALSPLIERARAEHGTAGLLFTVNDRPLDYWNWRRDQYRPACGRAKLKPRPRFHDLRHTYGTRLAAAGVPRHEIAKLMGHADEATTARYIHAGVDGHRLKLVRDALSG